MQPKVGRDHKTGARTKNGKGEKGKQGKKKTKKSKQKKNEPDPAQEAHDVQHEVALTKDVRRRSRATRINMDGTVSYIEIDLPPETADPNAGKVVIDKRNAKKRPTTPKEAEAQRKAAKKARKRQLRETFRKDPVERFNTLKGGNDSLGAISRSNLEDMYGTVTTPTSSKGGLTLKTLSPNSHSGLFDQITSQNDDEKIEEFEAPTLDRATSGDKDEWFEAANSALLAYQKATPSRTSSDDDILPVDGYGETSAIESANEKPALDASISRETETDPETASLPTHEHGKETQNNATNDTQGGKREKLERNFLVEDIKRRSQRKLSLQSKHRPTEGRKDTDHSMEANAKKKRPPSEIRLHSDDDVSIDLTLASTDYVVADPPTKQAKIQRASLKSATADASKIKKEHFIVQEGDIEQGIIREEIFVVSDSSPKTAVHRGLYIFALLTVLVVGGLGGIAAFFLLAA